MFSELTWLKCSLLNYSPTDQFMLWKSDSEGPQSLFVKKQLVFNLSICTHFYSFFEFIIPAFTSLQRKNIEKMKLYTQLSYNLFYVILCLISVIWSSKAHGCVVSSFSHNARALTLSTRQSWADDTLKKNHNFVQNVKIVESLYLE